MSIHHRDDLDAVQRELAEVPGVSVLIYDQTCASEKRPAAETGRLRDPDKRVIINELVCEACGDCSVQSNCVAVQPVETEFGRKRQIDQSNCNKDFSCVKGLLPVLRDGARGAGAQGQARNGVGRRAPPSASCRSPTIPAIDGTFNVHRHGRRRHGRRDHRAILGMAAHLEGKGSA
jgi:indolepyruvate ferredoxin oxidoreductase